MASLVMMDIHFARKDRWHQKPVMRSIVVWKIPGGFLTAYVDEQTVTRAAAGRPFGCQ